MNRKFFKKLTFVLLASISTQASSMSFFRNTAAIEPELMAELPAQTSVVRPVGPFSFIHKGHEALTYVSRDEVIESLNGISAAANNLVTKGVYIHWGLLPEIGFCTLGCAASLCGLGLITHTALQDGQPNSTKKYSIGAGMIGLGIAAFFTSTFFGKK